MENPVSLHTRDLCKEYQGRLVVDSLDLRVNSNEIYGLIGPNGAGKTTTINMLLGLLPPSRGEINILGQVFPPYDVTVRNQLGVVAEKPVFPKFVSGWDYLAYFASMYKIPNSSPVIEVLLKRMNLWDSRQQAASQYSLGMQKKLSIARALLHDPTILILDEPSSGLDPVGIANLRNLLLEKKMEGRAILICSHALREIEKIADRVGVLDRGRLIFEGALPELGNLTPRRNWVDIELEKPVPSLKELLLKGLPDIQDVEVSDCALRIYFDETLDPRASVSIAITGAGGVIVAMSQITPDLEESFLNLLGVR